MKTILSFITLLVSLLLLSQSIHGQTSISGKPVVCAGECAMYEVLNGTGGPYFWITTGRIQGSNENPSINICWDVIGGNEVKLLDFAAPQAMPSISMNVGVIANPDPEIIFPLYPHCEDRDTLSPAGIQDELEILVCETVCSGSVATYSALGLSTSTFSWEVTGGTVLSETADEITIEWNTTGSGEVNLIETNGPCEGSISYCIDILPPTDIDIIALNGTPTSIDVCLGQTVYLQGLGSPDVTEYEWIFDNGEYASGSSTSITYEAPGTYTVTLIGSTECGCIEMTDYTVHVDSNPGPEIMCTGTLCAGEEATYYGEQNCSSYQWQISGNGNVMDGGTPNDSYITVLWNSGPVGSVTLSTSGCDTPTCAEATTIQIPIIDNTATIAGQTVACKSGYSNYSIQFFNGADYFWSLSGNGSIIDGHGTNEITVKWDESPTSDDQALIAVQYDNCQLNCGGQADLTVDLLQPFVASMNETYCKDATAYIFFYEGWNSAIVDVELIDPAGTSTTFSDVSNIFQSFALTGTYEITATDPAGRYCNQILTTSFEVVDRPATPDTIFGPTVVCLNSSYIYSVPDIPGTQVRWIIEENGSTRNERGSSVSITWTVAGPKQIRAQYIMNELFCRSEFFSMTIEDAQVASISGPSSACVDDLLSYSSGTVFGSQTEWTITPTNAGSIKINADNTIDVTWHQAGSHQLSAIACGATLDYTIDVTARPAEVADFPERVCPGDLATVTVNTTLDVEILTEDDLPVTTGSISSVAPGIYKAIVRNPLGCEQIIPIVIDTFLPPVVRASSPDENLFCQPHPGVQIDALTTDDGYTYDWYHNGTAMGQTSPSITTSNFGSYYVIVTDQHGCQEQSNTHILYDDCGPPPPPGTCSGNGNSGVLSFGGISITCNNMEFNVKGTSFTSTQFTWLFGDPESGIDNTATGPTVTHTFTSAGHYYVYVVGNAGGEDAVDIFTVPAAPRFDYDRACAGSAVQFNNHCTTIPGYSITDYLWDFGDPSSGTDNLSTDKAPMHTYTSPGTYPVTLQIQASTGCISTYHLDVEVLPSPQGGFIAPQSTCADRGLQFVGIPSSDIISYSWDFDDVASGMANTSTSQVAVHEFATSGLYDVALTVADIFGCETTTVQTIDITTSSLSGDIIADQIFPMCFGETATLTAPSGGATYLWSTNESTRSISVTEAGDYSVTIDDGSGCLYQPDPIRVRLDGAYDNSVIGITYPDPNSIFSESHYDSLIVCEGTDYSLRVQSFWGATYTWSLGTSTQNLVGSSDLGNLPAGIYDITATTTLPPPGCTVDSKPFRLIVHPRPAALTIDAPSSTLCEGTAHTLSVNAPDPDLRYFWSTGKEGSSITVTTAGYYTFTAINKLGCEGESNGVFVQGLPDANRINLGCKETCFPDTLCTPAIANAAQYQWLLDGSPISSLLGSDLIVQQAGDYQLVVENFNGCTDTSGILSIAAMPNDQSISGIIYIDDNQNGIWDTGEILVNDVDVHLWENGSIKTTTKTDASGSYVFDPIDVVNPLITIDTTGLNLHLTGGSFSEMVFFTTCIEDRTQDFPLIRVCTPVNEASTEMVCPGQSITIEGVELWPGDVYPFMLESAAGCDSLHTVTVAATPDADVALDPTMTCPGEASGSLTITIMTGSALQFAIDNPSNFSSNLSFDNLSAGAHTLWLTDAYGCIKDYQFDIDIVAVPQLPMITTSACVGHSNGEVQIDLSAVSGVVLSLDGSQFSATDIFTDLPAGDHTIFAMDANGCLFEYDINIPEIPALALEVAVQTTCFGIAEGSIEVLASTTDPLEYSMDGISFGSSATFTGLSADTYTIYVRDGYGCTSTISATVSEEPEPVITFTTESSCYGAATGSFIGMPGYQYSLDNVTFSSDTIIEHLSAGPYTVYALGTDGCIHEIPMEIDETDPLEVIFEDPEIDCSVEQIVLAPEIIQSTGSLTYLWDDGSTSDTRSVTSTGTYTVEISDQCDNMNHNYEITIEEITADQPIYLPNIFSPDQNGINDCFAPTLADETMVLDYTMVIFDRWGNRLFESNDLNKCWDGTFNGADVRAGVFVYMLEMEYTYCVEVETLKKYGDITVIK